MTTEVSQSSIIKNNPAQSSQHQRALRSTHQWFIALAVVCSTESFHTMTTAPLRQAIAVVPKTRMGTLAAVAQASTYLMAPHMGWNANTDNIWHQWWVQDYGKLVKKASQSKFDQLLTWAQDHNIDHRIQRIGDDQALALAPMPADALPKIFQSMRLTGWDLEYTDDSFRIPAIMPQYRTTMMIHLDRTLELPAGKAAAQIAHALNTAVTTRPTSSVRSLIIVERPMLRRHRDTADIVITDNGHTLLEPGTVTAVVTYDR